MYWFCCFAPDRSEKKTTVSSLHLPVNLDFNLLFNLSTSPWTMVTILRPLSDGLTMAADPPVE